MKAYEITTHEQAESLHVNARNVHKYEYAIKHGHPVIWNRGGVRVAVPAGAIQNAIREYHDAQERPKDRFDRLSPFAAAIPWAVTRVEDPV